jgi:hypothetical protein
VDRELVSVFLIVDAPVGANFPKRWARRASAIN